MTDTLTTHLRRWATRAGNWWRDIDCAIVLADYVFDLTGKDGAAHLRGRYYDRESCIAVSGLDKGLCGVVADCVARVPLPATNDPQRGDIGVLRLGSHEVAGICIGDRWAVKSPDGVLYIKRPRVIAAWSVQG